MKNYILVCFSLVLLLPFSTLAQNFNPKRVLPQSLDKYNFGMSLNDFIKKNKSATASEANMSFRLEYNEKDAGKNIKEVTSYFDNDNNKPLYEIIIEFKDQESLNSHCSKKLGAPNDDGGKWKWTTKEGYIFKAWHFQNKLVCSLALPATEWEKEWRN